MTRYTNAFRFCSIFLFLTLIWELSSLFFPDLAFVLPPPSRIIGTLFICKERIFFHAAFTFEAILTSLCIAVLIALPLVWMMARFITVSAFVQVLFIIFQSLPTFCLAPLLVMWFGWGMLSVVLPAALMMLFPIAMSIYRGLQASSKEFSDYFYLLRATRWQLFWKLQVPSSLPYFFSGLRIALTISGIAVIGGEWVGAEFGLGVLMMEARHALDFELTFACLIVLCAMTVCFYLIGIFFEKRSWSMYRKILKLFPRQCIAGCIVSSLCLFPSCESGRKERERLGKTSLMLDWMPNPNHVPLFVGKHQGFFEKEGIILEIHKAPALDPLQPLTTGQVDVSVSYYPRTVYACARGVKCSIIAKLMKEPLDGFMVLEESGIRSPLELGGRTIGFSSCHFASFFLDTMMQSIVSEPFTKRDVHFELITALKTKQVDAIYGAYWNVEPVQMNSMGVRTRFFSVTEFGVPSYPELIFAAKKDTIYASPQYAKRFQKALQKSIDFCVQNPQKAFSIYMEMNPNKSPKTEGWEKDSWKRTVSVLAKDQEFPEEDVMDFLQWSKQKGLILRVPDYKECISQ